MDPLKRTGAAFEQQRSNLTLKFFSKCSSNSRMAATLPHLNVPWGTGSVRAAQALVVAHALLKSSLAEVTQSR